MADYITLLGSEQVQQAGYTMRNAAQEMQQAASMMESSQQQFLRQFEALVERMEQALDRAVDTI